MTIRLEDCTAVSGCLSNVCVCLFQFFWPLALQDCFRWSRSLSQVYVSRLVCLIVCIFVCGCCIYFVILNPPCHRLVRHRCLPGKWVAVSTARHFPEACKLRHHQQGLTIPGRSYGITIPIYRHRRYFSGRNRYPRHRYMYLSTSPFTRVPYICLVIHAHSFAHMPKPS